MCTSQGPGPFPGVLDLWGGGGQLVEYRAALLASHGFASMALDYLTPKVTMETGKMVGNDYLEVNQKSLWFKVVGVKPPGLRARHGNHLVNL